MEPFFSKDHTPSALAEISEQLGAILQSCYADPEAEPVLRLPRKQDVLDAFWQPKPPAEGIGTQNALKDFSKRVLPHSAKTWHPLFLNQMFAGTPVLAVIGDLLAGMMNPTLATWEMSPVGTVIESNVATWMAGLLGMKEGSGGVFLPGSSLGNLFALAVARNQRLSSDIRRGGMAMAPRGVILCSDASHYSVANAANLLGIGQDQVVKVATNEANEMLIEDLAEKLTACERDGRIPFAVVATMGITVTGGYDPLAEIVALCRQPHRNIHIHMDAAFGGGIALARGQKLLDGVSEVDSVVWDAHKWLYSPLTCTVLLVPDVGILKHSFNTGADYLFHPQGEDVNGTDDLGKYTLLCGKRFDALKVWLLFRAFGTEFFADLADSRLALAEGFYRLLDEADDFEVPYAPRSPLQCFRFVPDAMKNAEASAIDQMNRWIRETCKERGLAYFNVAKLKGRDYLRMILVNPLTNLDHMRHLLELIRDTGAEYLQREAETKESNH